MKKMYLLLLLVFIGTSCAKKEKQSVAEKNLENGYVFVDGTKRIIHWDKNCKRVHKNILLSEELSSFRDRKIEFCSCVPIGYRDSIILYNRRNPFAYKKKVSHDSISVEINENTKAPINKYMFCIDGKIYHVSEKNINKYGMDNYISSYPNATVRMCDDNGLDYDIPISLFYRAVSSGLHPYLTLHE